MIDPELREQLSIIEKDLRVIAKTNGMGKQFLRGIMSGVGYVTGAVIVLVIVGWVLNILGVIPAFTSYVADFKNAIEVIRSSSGR